MCCHPALTPAVGDRADAARGRRPDDRRDRAARSSCPRRRWRSASAAPSRPSRRRASRSRCPTADERDAAPRRRAARALPDLQRGLREQRRTGAAARRPRERGDPPRARARTPRCPSDAEVAGLLALMLLTDARRAARTGPSGELIPLAEQDRALWDAAADRRGRRRSSATRCRAAPSAPTSCRRRSPPCTTRPPSVEDTDWPQILALYGLLERMSDNPMVALNRAIAAAMVHGPRPGSRSLDAARRRRPARRPPPPRRRARAPARDGRGPRGRDRALPVAAGRPPACPSSITC